jgi:hypothetical protein
VFDGKGRALTKTLCNLGILFVAILMPEMAGTLAQDPGVQRPGPKQVVQELLNLQMSGAVLQSAGWKNVNELFLRYNSRKEAREIEVVSPNYTLEEIPVNQNLARVVLKVNEIGMISPNLQWRSRIPATPGFGYLLVFGGAFSRNSLAAARESSQPRAWRIESEFPFPVWWFSKATAIRYVTETRDKSNDPAVKANADKTLAILQKLQE